MYNNNNLSNLIKNKWFNDNILSYYIMILL